MNRIFLLFQDYLNQFTERDFNIVKERIEDDLRRKISKSELMTNAENRLISELQKIYILTCEPSTTVLPHKEEVTADCQTVNDDQNRETKISTKTYVEYNSMKHYISNCKTTQSIPYINSGSIWQVSSRQGRVTLGTNSAKVSGVIYGSNPYNAWMASLSGNNCSSVSYPDQNLITYKTKWPGNAREYVNFNLTLPILYFS